MARCGTALPRRSDRVSVAVAVSSVAPEPRAAVARRGSLQPARLGHRAATEEQQQHASYAHFTVSENVDQASETIDDDAMQSNRKSFGGNVFGINARDSSEFHGETGFLRLSRVARLGTIAQSVPSSVLRRCRLEPLAPCLRLLRSPPHLVEPDELCHNGPHDKRRSPREIA